MVKLTNPKFVTYKNKEYAVYTIKKGTITVPIILDKNIHELLKKVDLQFYVNENLMLYTKVDIGTIGTIGTTSKPKIVDIYLHEIVMKLQMKLSKIAPIIHINKINVDNRISNLIFDTTNKDQTKNLHKKDRTIDLSDDNIDTNTLPSFVWYLKADDSHGDRFIVEMGPIKWKSTSSRKLSLRYKLEEMKKFLRLNKEKYPSLFKEYCMNGDLNDIGENLKKEYYAIINLAGLNYKYNPTCKTNDFLKENLSDLSQIEKELLKQFNLNCKETTNDRLKKYL
jgi:hypothetical protein